ncbi:low specificity L-threonine aldolase [Paenibacillus albicereus]|uniref:Low specificity L-threonine aldolase n=1 Tax=Paenibacillus albicereus TaxID=2726185 RepID=A0A6H2GT70_9BACL|nr:beta-eliminating lyase-related protein [Paenibacillus albicereus]QJC50623.1 low specificity L-threonine aldolase [Paenibacillus albicereus]
MGITNGLAESFAQAEHIVTGSSKRSMRLLLRAFEEVDGDQASDMYGKGEVIEAFQTKMAKLLGKETAVFFPSGTMAQQIALRIWCDRKGIRKAAYHPLCHLEIHEERGLHELHGIQPVLLGGEDRLITLQDVQQMGEVGCLLLELPQREIGGQLPPFEELEAISAWCRDKGIPLHLDGARLFEIVPYYGRSEAEICRLFDSVYVSFYKGLGGIAGAVLVGDAGLAGEAKVWKRRHGGDLISLYPYIVSSDYYLDLRRPKMSRYYDGAKELARRLNEVAGLHTVPETPVSNMFHLHAALPAEQAARLFEQAARETGVALVGYVQEKTADRCASELSIGDRYEDLPPEKLEQALVLLDRLFREAGCGDE